MTPPAPASTLSCLYFFFNLYCQIYRAESQLLCPSASSTCPDSNVKFYLTTRGSRTVQVADTEAGVAAAPFVDAPLEVIIHGLTGSLNTSPNTLLIPGYLGAGDFNVLSVDYEPLARYVWCLPSAAQGVGRVGACLGRMLRLVFARGLLGPARTHLVGFSLGAQIAGAAGRSLAPTYTLARITGLEAGNPFFKAPPLFPCLGPTDAAFVDVLHTDGGVMGVQQPIGTVDFYINKGYGQPGCLGSLLPGTLLDLGPSDNCSHFKSVEAFAASLIKREGLAGVGCAYDPLGRLKNSDLCPPDQPPRPEARMGHFAPTNVRGTYRVTFP